MPYITRVRAWGLWSHWESIFDSFSPRLNVIVGPNDSGKSAFNYLCKWVFLGEPEGEYFLFELIDDLTGEVKKSAKEGRAEVTVDNNTIITKTRKRGGKTVYELEAPGRQKQTFTQAEVPQEIADILGIKSHKFGDFEDALNFFSQLAAPFLISESPQTGARVLGKLANVEAVDYAIKESRGKVYNLRQAKTKAEEDITKATEGLKEYENLDELRQQLEACEYLINEIDKDAARGLEIKTLVDRYQVAQEKVARLEESLKQFAIIPDLKFDMQYIEEAQQRYDAILGLYGELTAVDNRLNLIITTLQTFTELENCRALISEIEADNSRLDAIDTLYKQYQKTTETLARVEEVLAKSTDVKEAAALLLGVEKQQVRADTLRVLMQDYADAEVKIANYGRIREQFKGLEEAAQILKDISQDMDRLTALKTTKQLYDLKENAVASATGKLNRATIELEEAKKEYADAIQATGGVCPLLEIQCDKLKEVI
jgi:exonuclease SbcC